MIILVQSLYSIKILVSEKNYLYIFPLGAATTQKLKLCPEVAAVLDFRSTTKTRGSHSRVCIVHLDIVNALN